MFMLARVLAALVVISAVILAGRPIGPRVAASPSGVDLGEGLSRYIGDRLGERDLIAPERCAQLDALARDIRSRLDSDGSVELVFVCEHNADRSQMAQLWAQASARWFGVEGVWFYSGGLDAASFDTRAVAAIDRAGFEVAKAEYAFDAAGPNPGYRVRCGNDATPTTCFSKRLDDATNPSRNFGAVMLTSLAEADPPAVSGAAFRCVVPYTDPKAVDPNATEADAYDARCKQIAREMLYVFASISE